MAVSHTSFVLLLWGSSFAVGLPCQSRLRLAEDGLSSPQDDSVTANVSCLTDSILEGLRDYLPAQGMDIVPLPDVHQNFTVTMLILSMSGELNMTNGSMANLDKLRRYEDTRVRYLKSNINKSLVIETSIELEEITAEYEFMAKVGVLHKQGSVRVSLSGMRVRTMLNMGLDSLIPHVVDFKIVDMGSITMKIQSGLLGWLASFIANLLANILKRDLEDKIREEVPGLLQAALDNLDIAALLRPPANLT